MAFQRQGRVSEALEAFEFACDKDPCDVKVGVANTETYTHRALGNNILMAYGLWHTDCPLAVTVHCVSCCVPRRGLMNVWRTHVALLLLAESSTHG